MAEEISFPLFTSCKLTLSDKIPCKKDKLYKLLTDVLQFKISGFTPLVIEKDCPSKQDMCKLFDAVKELEDLGSFNFIQDFKDESKVVGELEETDSDEEYIFFSMMKSTFHIAKNYFKNSDYKSFFNTAVREGTGYILKLNACNDRDVKFLGLLKKLKFEEFEFGQRDIILVDSTAQNIMSELDSLTLFVKGNKVHLIGSKDVVALGRKKLASLLQTEDERTQLSSRSMPKKDETTEAPLKEEKLDVIRKSDTRQIPGNETDHEISKSQYPVVRAKTPQSSNSTTELYLHSHSLLNRPLDHKTRDSSINNSGDNGPGAYLKHQTPGQFTTELSQLRVQVYIANITELKVDCIVNAANKRLQLVGGVSRAISKAAGQTMNKECEDFIKAGNLVDVSDIFVSNGGQLPAKYVMHTVGPKWDSYENKITCVRDLRHTVLRCLVEASRRKMTSVALPSISAAIFKVPKEECAKCYLEAVKHFDILNAQGKEQGTLKEIHFVDIDVAMINIIREMFMKKLSEPCDMKIVQEDIEFVENHLVNISKQEAAKYERSSSKENKLLTHNKPTSTSTLTRTTEGASAVGTTRQSENNAAYAIGRIILCVKSKSALDLTSDIIFTFGKPFDKLSGIQDFVITSNLKRNDKMHNLKNTFEFLNVCKPHGKQPHLLCAVYPEPDNDDKIKEAFKNLEKAIYSNDLQNMKALVLTSSILYAESSNKQQKKGGKNIDTKQVGKFAHCLYDYLKKKFDDTRLTQIIVTVVADDNAVLSILKAIECLDVKKVSPIAYPGSSQGTGSMTESRGQEYGSYPHSQEKYNTFSMDLKYPGSVGIGDVGSSVDFENVCEICLENKLCKAVRCCKNLLCLDCESKVSVCPFCRTFWKVIYGNQPPGTMSVTRINDYPEGYEKTIFSWKIDYEFPSGIQTAYHPRPGNAYSSARHTAYLPVTDDGFRVLLLLRLAFIRKLVFTIGHSLTSNKEDSIIWNGIHHKTRLHGGLYGYPDPKYLCNVLIELGDKRVGFETLSQPEKQQLDYFYFSITTLGHFHDYIAK